MGVAAVALLLAGGLTAQSNRRATAMTGTRWHRGHRRRGSAAGGTRLGVSEAPEQVASDVSPGEAAKISVASVNPDGKAHRDDSRRWSGP